jgi:hypothetical protein
MASIGSDHIPITVSIGTHSPKCNIFRFEEFWLEFDGLKEVVDSSWINKGFYKNSAQDITARFKSLRHGIKMWSRNLSKLSSIIQNCSYVLAMFDGLEEQRALSIMEHNFWKALRKHLAKLLEAKRIYWRKRANIRWAKLGDENTKFFHAIGTRNYRQNHIAVLHSSDNVEVTKHNHKAAILWNAFKDRLGQSVHTEMMFDLNNLITPTDLSVLEAPFSHEEIDNIINQMPNEKAPGPDGFNGIFMNFFWYLLKDQFYVLCNAFYDGNVDLHSLNIAFITLIPKIDNPMKATDFRPISLVSMAMKIITKLLANRMQEVIIPILHKNQYGFIKSKTIQDCLAWAFEYLHICHQSKKEIIIVKLDFEKAFDMVEYKAILTMLKHFGFGEKWLEWINCILHSASTSIILNGVPGKQIICKRGVRQGDPLSPILYVATAELL